MAYEGVQQWDEFNDESIATFWTQTANATTLTEHADGVLRTTFNGIADYNQKGIVTQGANDGLEPISAGTPLEITTRFYIEPIPYTVSGINYPIENIHSFRAFEWSMWDDNIYCWMKLSWNYAGTPSGYDMALHESCYTIDVGVDNEYDSEDVTYGPSWMTDRGVDTVLQFADENHNGWFVIKYSIDKNGNQLFLLTPDGGDTYNVTPPGLTPYDLDIGGKGGWGWGFDLTASEYNWGPSYVGGSPGPVDIDWIRGLTTTTLQGVTITKLIVS